MLILNHFNYFALSIEYINFIVFIYYFVGSTLEIVTDKSQEGAQFVKGFGGIGGWLITVNT